MLEWSTQNKYNSFNSYKGLTYYDNYRKIVAWMEGAKTLPPPVECNLDPFAGCNLSCYFCITQRYLRAHLEEVGPMRTLPTSYMHRLVDFLASWGVRGLCISGGGEPTLHSGVPEVLIHARNAGMKTSVFTNAVKMSEGLVDPLLGCQFISISINGANRETFQKIEGADCFNKVVENLSHLSTRARELKSETFTCVRMLILPENYTQIHKLCKLAKDLGMKGFNVRPVDFERNDIVGHRKLSLPVELIQEELNKCHEESEENFKVFTVTHKFDSEFHVHHDFNMCLSTPLLIPILQDGNAYLCVDKKMEASYRLGSCYPNPEEILKWWGSDYHRDIIKSVDVNLCSRCTFGQYNRQIEEVVGDDSMFVSFP